MKAIIQRVTRASVSVDGEVISSIGKGLCILLGISRDDTSNDIQFMIRKLLNLRVFENESGKRWDKCIKDYNFEILCVSQFTLCCKLKGNKPDFHLSMSPEQSEKLYSDFIEQLKKAYKPDLVKDGKFGALMQVHIQNDGPVTIELESPSSSANSKSDIFSPTRKLNHVDYQRIATRHETQWDPYNRLYVLVLRNKE